MGGFKITSIVFGLWIGLLVAGSAIVELALEGQIYSYRTFSLVSILFISGVFSSAFSWLFFSRFGSSIFRTAIILCLSNLALFCFFGVLISYIVIVLPHLFDPDSGHKFWGIKDLLIGIFLGTLGVGFSFKTFGLPLLWPFGMLSGLMGTFIFVYADNMRNSNSRH